MKNKRLFSIDLDGTLLTPDYKIGSLTKPVFRSLLLQGDVILLSSGRPIRTLMPYYKELGLVGPISCYNGAYIGQPENPLCFPPFDPYLHKEEILDVLAPFVKDIDFFMGESHDEMKQTASNPFLAKYFPVEGTKQSIVSSLTDIPEEMKIFIFSAPASIAKQIQERVAKYPSYRFHSWKSEPYYEIVLASASKADALRRVASYYGIDKENTFAFGDSENDFPMLEEAGHPFAMHNCKSSRLGKAFPQTEKGNDQDGVAFEILKYCD